MVICLYLNMLFSTCMPPESAAPLMFVYNECQEQKQRKWKPCLLPPISDPTCQRMEVNGKIYHITEIETSETEDKETINFNLIRDSDFHTLYKDTKC